MIGSGRETMTGLAAGLSAAEDRELLSQLNQNFGFNSSPSFEVSTAGQFEPSNSAQLLDAVGAFEPNLCGFDDALDPQRYGIDERFFDESNSLANEISQAGGVPWPTPWTEPDDWLPSQSSAVDPTNMAGLRGGLEGVFLESLQGLGVAPTVAGKNERRADFRVAISAAFQPGTKLNKEVTRKLLDKSVALADLAEKRATVTKKARDQFEANLKEIERNDREVARLFSLTFDERGALKPGASDANLKRLLELRAKNVELGRKTVRLQKLNMLASAITNNTLTQITSVQNMAQAVATGAPGAVPALGLAFDKLGRENAKIKEIRAKQLERWHGGQAVKNTREEHGLDGFDGLYGLDVVERPFDCMEHELAALEFSFKKTFRKAKKAAKNVAKTTKNVAREVGKAGKSLAKATVIAPTKGTIEAAKKISRGDVKGAFKSVGRTVVEQAKSVKDFAARTLLKWPCEIADTSAFKGAVKATGQAAGAVVGSFVSQPQLGSAVGKEGGGQAANLQRNTCGAMRTVGLTDGRFKKGQIDNAAKGFAKRAWRETLSPQAQLRSAKNIASDYLAAQAGGIGGMGGMGGFKVGGVDVLGKLGLDPNKLATSNPLVNQLVQQGTSKFSSRAGEAFTQLVPGAGKLTPEVLKALQTGQVSLPNINPADLAKRGVSLAQREGIQLARRGAETVVRKALKQGAPRFVSGNASVEQMARLVKQGGAAPQAVRGVRATPAQLRRIAGQLSPALIEPAKAPARQESQFLSQPTDEVSPYVGSIGRFI